MASFLKRARSTRDQRHRAAKHQQELAFTTANLNAQHIIIEDQENYSPRPQANILKLRRKSFSSSRESKMALGLPESWDPPATETMTFEERKKRTSVFFGLSPAPPPLKTEHKAAADAPPKRAPPPPPIRVSAFPPRKSSTHGDVVVDGVDDGEILDPDHYMDDEPGYIGMALGSPGGAVHTPLFTRSTENLPPTPGKSPVFFLPAEPFAVGTTYSTIVSAAGHVQKPEEQRPQGWKRLFGKSLFGRRGTIKASREPIAEVLEPVPPPPAPAPPPTKLRKNSKTPAPPPSAPCLDVDIPSVEMERYSVMFGTVLSDPPKANLYARRRSKDLNSLFSGTDSIHDSDDTMSRLTGEPAPRLALNSLKRNATTGSHLSPRSPLSMLGDNLKRLSTDRSRSPSPQRPSTSPQPYTKDNMLSPPPRMPALPPPLPSPAASRPVSVMSTVSEEIPTPRGSFDAGDDKWLTQPQEAEPQWEMVTGPRAEVTRDEALKNEATSTQEAMNALLEDPEKTQEETQEEELVVAAQISIARQISVSRGQLLLPVVPEARRLVGRRSVKESMRPRLVQHSGPAEAVVDAV